MQKRVTFSLENPPLRFLAKRLFEDSSFIEKAKWLVSLSQEQIGQLSRFLGNQDAFLSVSSDRLIEGFSEKESTDFWEVVRKPLAIISQSDEAAVENWNELTSRFQRYVKKDFNALDQEYRGKLFDILNSLVLSHPSILAGIKAERLVTATGQPLERFDLICDLRPVFSDARESIVGAVVLTTVRVELASPSQAFDITLTEDGLLDVYKKIERAVKKVELLKSFACEKEVAVYHKDTEGMQDE